MNGAIDEMGQDRISLYTYGKTLKRRDEIHFRAFPVEQAGWLNGMDLVKQRTEHEP
ncbi:hypothetical protein FOMG_17804 [Fusarium oxysporum f. sp. melonis 26406]|uniref:Uncharacterized protein n=1 Tax=Fusarium oxysporum f. sp. melonis 26406 TaxID=1089452 RepID=W9ZAC9_FUSOX|nr:hypothetical protein FOMG_17804 [Fusarium oxysporum f. sp. melonis 26406]